MVVLLRRKVPIGGVMFLGSGTLVLLYAMDGGAIIAALQGTVRNPVTVKLLFALSLIRIFELVLREQGVLAAMMHTVKHSFRSTRAIIISMPMLIGMLPSLGGAYFSAPMVKEATAGLKMKDEEKAFINYWFRHPWEYVLPLYPGILLAAAVSSIPLSVFMKANLPYALTVFGVGFLFSMRTLTPRQKTPLPGEHTPRKQAVRDWMNFFPIGIVLILVVLLKIELQYALLAVTVPLIAFYRYGLKETFRLFRHGFARDVLILISGTMLFKETMEVSGAVANLSRFFLEQNIPLLPIVCLLPFISGMLTGLTVGFVGSTFPLLISMAGSASLSQMSLAFATGFIGVLLSPVHLCLVLTREYFKADFVGIYRKMVPACGIVLAVAIAEYLFLSSLGW